MFLDRKTLIKHLQLLPHKAGVNPKDWELVDHDLLYIAEYYIDFCTWHRLPVLFTSIIRKGIPGISVSVTHEQGRAYDNSVKGWTVELCKQLEREINELFSHIGAISLSDGKSRACIYKDGTAMHHHNQVRR